MTEPELAVELVTMMDEDQAAWQPLLGELEVDAALAAEWARRFAERGGWDVRAILEWPNPPTIVSAYQRVHHRNSRRLREIVAAVGWPARSAVGEAAADAAWLILQHDGDPAFQAESLELMLRLPRLERDLKHYAFTADLLGRVMGEPPRFGTMGPPVEDVSALDTVRAEFDLPPFEDQEACRAAGLVTLPAGIGRATPGFAWPPTSRP